MRRYESKAVQFAEVLVECRCDRCDAEITESRYDRNTDKTEPRGAYIPDAAYWFDANQGVSYAVDYEICRACYEEVYAFFRERKVRPTITILASDVSREALEVLHKNAAFVKAIDRQFSVTDAKGKLR